MVLEVRIPISPRPAWLNRVRLIAASVRRYHPDAIVTVSCYPPNCLIMDGDRPGNYVHIETFRFRYPMDADFDAWAGTRSEYLATMMDRYKPPFYGDHILMLDADVLCTGPLDELFEWDAIQGVQAHVPPFSASHWRQLFLQCGLPLPAMVHEYSGFGPMFTDQSCRLGPWYANSGMIFGPRKLFEQIAEPYGEMIRLMRGIMSDTYWFDQTGLALAVEAAGVMLRSLPLRWNFPNQAAFDKAYPEELADVRFIHFLRTDTVDRDRDFEDVHAMHRFIARTDLVGSNEVLRRHVADLMPEAFPGWDAGPVEGVPWA